MPPRDSRTVSDVRREKKRPKPPARPLNRIERELIARKKARDTRPIVGESAAEKTRPRQSVRGESTPGKARTAVQGRARDIFEEIMLGAPAKESRQRLLATGMTADEGRDFSRYTAVRSDQVQDEAFRRLRRDTASAIDEIAGAALGVKPSDAYATVTDPLGSLRDHSSRGSGSGIYTTGLGPVRFAKWLDRVLPAGKLAAPAELRTAGAARKVRPMPEGATRPTRSLRLNEKEQQLPAARSRVTRTLIEKPADKLSAALMGEGKLAGAARRALPTASAQARVAKAAGREQVVEASRAQARMQEHLKALPKKEGSPEDIAHSWWAQLPASHRNAAGLKLVRGKQAEALEEITSGRALEALKRQQGAIRAKLAKADADERFDLMRQAEDVKLLISDLPLRVEDISTSLARLDKVIARPPKLNPKTIDAVHALGRDRREILTAANVLDPARASEREGLVSRWVGLEPTGEEAFLGHRLGKVRGSQPSLTPVSVGAGRVKLPQGVSRENKLVLAKTGRLRESTRVAAEDWQAAQVYRSATTARTDLAKMGTPFDGRLPEGYVLVNPRGRAVPPHWKTDKLAKISEQGFDEDEIAKASKEIVDTFVADADGLDRMLAAAKQAGVKWEELRVVPENVANRYFGQFTPPAGATKAGKAYDAAVDFTAASIVFARLGYIPKNIAQNLIVAVPHQGPKLLLNAPRAGQILADKELRPLVQAEVGFTGATQGLAQEARFLKSAGKKARSLPAKTAGAVGTIGDDPLRISAFVHEAAAAGVISKWKPVLDEADRANLVQLLTDKQYRPLLNDIRSRSVEAMADFSRLTPTQRRWARRFLIIPGWLWAGSRYPFHFAATHPGRTAAIAAGAYLGQDKIRDRKAEGLPSYLAGVETGGGKVLRTTSLSPISTPWEIAGALAQKSPRKAGDYANPLASALWNVANSTATGPNGPYRTDFPTSLRRNAERLAPNIPFVRDLARPPEDSRYPEDASRLGRLKRELGVFPIEIQRELTPPQRAVRKVFDEREQMFLEAKRLMPGELENGRLPKPIREAFNKKARRFSAYAAAGLKSGDDGYQRKAFALDLKLFQEWGVATPAEIAEARAFLKTADDEQIEKIRRRWSDDGGPFHTAYLGALRTARDALAEKGATFDEGE